MLLVLLKIIGMNSMWQKVVVLIHQMTRFTLAYKTPEGHM